VAIKAGVAAYQPGLRFQARPVLRQRGCRKIRSSVSLAVAVTVVVAPTLFGEIVTVGSPR
jgi:hypothetical protein